MLYCVLMPRHSAEKIRRENLREINNILLVVQSDEKFSSGTEQIEVLIRRIERMDEGGLRSFFATLVIPGHSDPVRQLLWRHVPESCIRYFLE